MQNQTRNREKKKRKSNFGEKMQNCVNLIKFTKLHKNGGN